MAEPTEAAVESPQPGDRSGSFRRELLIGGAHLAALWAIAFVQPLLDLLGSNPDFFVARGNTAGDILILAIGFAVLPPLAMLAIEALVSLANRAAYRIVHLGLVAVLVGFFAVQVIKRIGGLASLPTPLIVLAALALGGLVAYGLARTRFVRSLFDVLAFAPPVILAIFIFTSGASKLILPQSEAKALEGGVASDTPVVVAIFDELPTATLLNRQGQIDAKRFPGFAELARGSTWYPNNTTVADFTGRAVPAIMTGKNPDGEKLPIAADQPESLFTLLGGKYEMHVHETVTQICPAELCGGAEIERDKPRQAVRLRDLYNDLKYVEGRLVLPPKLANELPNVSTTFGDFGNNEDDGGKKGKKAGAFVRDLFQPPSPEDLEAFIDEIPDGDRTLSLIHIEVPHEPFRFLPDGTTYNQTDISYLNTPSAQNWAVGQAGITSVEQRHYLQTGYADTLVQSMIRRLKQTGIWDRAMVVVTADHGISFKPGEFRRIAEPVNLGGVANPPLFIKYPDQSRGEVSDIHTRTIDIVPTIAEELRVERPYETEGRPISEDTTGGEVEIRNGRTETVTASIDDVLRERDQVVAESARLLGDGGLDRLGPAPELIGRPAPPATGFDSAKLERPEIFENVKPNAGSVPAFVTGTLDEVEAGSILAVSVNGRIAGTTRAFLYDGNVHFGVVVPKRFLGAGRNEIGIYAVGPDRSLAPLGGN